MALPFMSYALAQNEWLVIYPAPSERPPTKRPIKAYNHESYATRGNHRGN